MKGQVAASAVALATLAREGWRGSGDLIFVAAADEEVGDGFGLEWLVEAHPDAVRCDFSRRTRARATGSRSAAGRLPLLDRREDELAVSAARARPQRPRVDAVDRRQRARQGGAARRAAGGASRRAGADPGGGGVLRGGDRRGAGRRRGARGRARRCRRSRRAGRAAARHDRRADEGACVRQAQRHPRGVRDHRRLRLLPGQTTGRTRRRDLRGWLGEGDYELVNTEREGGTRSPIGGPLWDAVAVVRRGRGAEAVAAPICCGGFTDSHWVRDAFGTVAYGFFPSRMDAELAARLIHSADERVPVDRSRRSALRFLLHAARTVCWSSSPRSRS